MNYKPVSVIHILWKGEIGGAERAVYQLIREQMKDPTLEPAIAFGQAGGVYWEKISTLGCAVINLDLPRGSAFWKTPSIASKLRPYQVHHFHSAEIVIMLGSLACPKAWRVYTQRGGQKHYNLRKRLIFQIAGYILRKSFNKISGNTIHAANYAAELYKFPKEEIHVTYNPIDFNLLKPEKSREVIFQELGLQKYRTVIGTSANLRPLKRIDRLIRLIANIKQADIGLLIVGDGIDRYRLEKLTDILEVRSQVVFAGKQNNIADFLQGMDIYCLPSGKDESFGNGLVEAMAMGIPSLIFEDSGGMVEHIENGKTGFIVKDEEELKTTIIYLMNNPKIAWLIGQAASEKVRQKYNSQQAATEYKNLYPIMKKLFS